MAALTLAAADQVERVAAVVPDLADLAIHTGWRCSLSGLTSFRNLVTLRFDALTLDRGSPWVEATRPLAIQRLVVHDEAQALAGEGLEEMLQDRSRVLLTLRVIEIVSPNPERAQRYCSIFLQRAAKRNITVRWTERCVGVTATRLTMAVPRVEATMATTAPDLSARTDWGWLPCVSLDERVGSQSAWLRADTVSFGGSWSSSRLASSLFGVSYSLRSRRALPASLFAMSLPAISDGPKDTRCGLVNMLLARLLTTADGLQVLE